MYVTYVRINVIYYRAPNHNYL